jgi:ketosteroid isomerase-like protein
MDTLPAELQEVIDRQKIYDVLTRYCRALDRCDVEAMKSVYWPDGYDEHGVFNGNAQEFAVFIIEEIQKWFEVTHHAICNVHMEIDGDVAYTEAYLLAYNRSKDSTEQIRDLFGPTYLAALGVEPGAEGPQDFFYGGRYIDKLEKRNGEWRIKRRTVVMDWNQNLPNASIWDEGMFSVLKIRGERSKNDSVYRRD